MEGFFVKPLGLAVPGCQQVFGGVTRKVVGELLRLFAVRDRDPLGPPGPDALLERSVVDVARDVELAIELAGLPSRWVKPVLPRAMHTPTRKLRTAPDCTHDGHTFPIGDRRAALP